MNKQYLYVANWKMYRTFDQTIAFVTKQYDELLALAAINNIYIVLCPSAPAIYPLSQMFQETSIAIGAQDCSEQNAGSFTGQISAQDLREAGCSYCIIGHSERRIYNAESNECIAKKCVQLVATNITPIICIGETEEQFKQGQTQSILEQQLAPIINQLRQYASTLTTPIIIAYEPTWSIGSNILPPEEHLKTVFAWLTTTALKSISLLNKKLIYGGSVNSQTKCTLKQIEHVEGFLIGRASLTFEEFEKIVK